ncbi:BTB/POZ and MATH domain-containing protein 3-like isoform X2 [Rutidosis leptorrhynchoides]|uniref:BTB/POZ and MATH domain-containing protein 3-like isoform X2 n=1 Tax=Rutidosis leptorrhynchoides TaxID=125765 RepID=UPI003A99225F
MLTNNFDHGISSGSKSINESVNGSHDFTIRGYSLAKALASDGTDVRALFELTLLDQSGKGKHKVHSHFDRALESGPYTLKYRGSMWGYKRFFRRVSLETSDYLKDDCLSMHCTVGVVRNRVEGPKHITISIPPSDMGQNLKYLLETETGCDIVFRVGGETFKAHKLILAARSPVFRAQFFGLVGNPNMDEIELMDIEPSVFKGMLMFIYSDNLPDSQEVTGSMSMNTSINIIQHMLAAADRFGLDRLKQLCEAKLCEEVTVDTVATTLSLADQHRCSQLKAICLKFAAANLGVVMQTEGFKYVEETWPMLLSELLETIASSVAVDERSGEGLSRKRSGSSIIGLDFGSAAAESADPNARRMRRRL